MLLHRVKIGCQKLLLKLAIRLLTWCIRNGQKQRDRQTTYSKDWWDWQCVIVDDIRYLEYFESAVKYLEERP